MCNKDCPDLIDFPVSDAWRDYYYERGLTPFHSPSYHQNHEGLDTPISRVAELMERLSQDRGDRGNLEQQGDSRSWQPLLPPPPKGIIEL